jgi:hypothetical protein
MVGKNAAASDAFARPERGDRSASGVVDARAGTNSRRELPSGNRAWLDRRAYAFTSAVDRYLLCGRQCFGRNRAGANVRSHQRTCSRRLRERFSIDRNFWRCFRTHSIRSRADYCCRALELTSDFAYALARLTIRQETCTEALLRERPRDAPAVRAVNRRRAYSL